jgi:hypothetical protein
MRHARHIPMFVLLAASACVGDLRLLGQATHNHEDPAAAPSASAQDKGMMGMHGMMEMMNDPVHQTAMTVFALPEMTTELGLSTQQAADLRKMKQELVDKTKDMAREPKNKELDATFAKMKASLSEEQRTKLTAMKSMDVHQLAMSKVPMAEHPVMAGFASKDMPDKGMMKKGMMNKKQN